MASSPGDPCALDAIRGGEEVSLDEDAGLPSLRASSLARSLGGSRLLYGSSDGELRCVDFFKWMSGGCGPLWTKKLDQGVAGVAINNDDTVVAAASGTVVSFYSDAGDHLVNTTKGDMYLLDARKTRGHTAAVTCVCADPQQFNLFTSGSIDGTVRTFDVDSPRQGVAMSVHSSHAYVPRAARGPRAPIRSLCFATIKGVATVVGGTDRGNLLTWDRRTAYPGAACMDAHMSGVSCVASFDDSMLFSRCDDTVKLWDLRNFKSPVKDCAVPGGDCSGNMALSPDGLHVAVGEVTPINPRNVKEGFKGCIRVLCTASLAVVETFRLKAPPGPVCWSHEGSQLFSACQDGRTWCRSGSDALESMHLDRARAAVRQKAASASRVTVSVQPEAYPIDELPDNLEEAEDGTLKRRRVPRQYKKPGAREEPEPDYISYGRTPVNYEDEDIVTKLRAMEGDADRVSVAAAATGVQRVPYKADKFMRMYKRTQPDLILDFTTPETKEESMLQGVQKCPRCGIKICQCGYMDSRK
ncbi:WD domain, G-beta repeat-containing protein [Babesia caballi]|uniref:WD domain, G-beta repeat-containing protein n=1 Tax=Babesia caballi TaxID=5871 RepID=A0AAV4LYD0_BABCB|nr:WD domain, G-beta repeat-containing protein [Babesia caballi]